MTGFKKISCSAIFAVSASVAFASIANSQQAQTEMRYCRVNVTEPDNSETIYITEPVLATDELQGREEAFWEAANAKLREMPGLRHTKWCERIDRTGTRKVGDIIYREDGRVRAKFKAMEDLVPGSKNLLSPAATAKAVSAPSRPAKEGLIVRTINVTPAKPAVKPAPKPAAKPKPVVKPAPAPRKPSTPCGRRGQRNCRAKPM